MDPTIALVWGVLLPLALSAAAGGAASAREPGKAARGWPAALAVSFAFLCAFHGIKGLPLPTPRESIHWVAWAAPIGLALGLCESLAPSHHRVGWGLRLAAVAFLVAMMVRRKASLWEEGGQAIPVALALGAGWLLLFLSLDLARSALPKAEPDPEAGGAGAALAIMGVVGTSSVVLGLGGSALVAQLGGALALALGPLLVAAWWRPGRPLLRGAAGPVGAVWGALLVNAALFVPDLPGAVPVLLVVAPFGANLARVPWVRARPAWLAAGLSTLAALVPIGVAGGLVWSTMSESPY